MTPAPIHAICRHAICLTCLALGSFASPVLAKEQPANIADFLDQNCTACHDEESNEGDLDLESLSLELTDPDNFHLWQRVFDRVREGEMPPDEELDDKDTSRFLASVHRQLQTSDADRIASLGRVPARRLTRAQYERNVWDLLAFDVPLQEVLPAESLSDGFDTVSKSQQISDHLMAAYLNAADVALDAAFARVLTDRPPMKGRLNWRQLRRREYSTNREPEGRPDHKDIVSWSTRQNFYGRMHATKVPVAGRYRIRVLAEAVNPPDDGRIWCSLRSGVCSAMASTMYWIDSFEATSEPTEHEFVAWIRKDHQLQLRPNDRSLRQAPSRDDRGHINGPPGIIETLGYPGVAVKWIEMERIDHRAEDDQARRALIGDLSLMRVATSKTGKRSPPTEHFEIVSENPEEDLRELIHAFAQRAFRRPVSQDELLAYVQFAGERLKNSGSMHDALRAAYRTILCSSRFLYFQESPGLLDDHALATRLSHFLWGRGPDDELHQLASAGRLGDPNVLRQQTERLLADPRSATLIEEFTDQWLMLYEINSTTPDADLYPEYDDVLHHSLVQETHAFVRELINHDLSVTNVVDSDFTYCTSRLARHYDIEWPGGTGLQRLELDAADRRGGIITQASAMKVTANGTTTSPITRGVWMLERIMGQHVPPPPANVPAVEPDIRGATSIRDQLDKHRKLESCAACHVKIDPPGFALESYDVIGGWRDRYRAVSTDKDEKWVDGLFVDPSHQLTTGQSFRNINELKQLLIQQPEQLAHNLASHLVTYATGAAPSYADRQSIDAIVRAAESSGYGVRSLLNEVVQSQLFRHK